MPRNDERAKEIAARMRKFRTEYLMTQENLAFMLGLSRQTVSNLERGLSARAHTVLRFLELEASLKGKSLMFEVGLTGKVVMSGKDPERCADPPTIEVSEGNHKSSGDEHF
jgi:DNA-binding XRE family transcriptional regulator